MKPAILAAACIAAAGAATAVSGIVVRPDGRTPEPWRALDAEAQAQFDLGHAVFNTSWLPPGESAGRRGGLGPHFNAPSCDACHNSRRRGRGPAADGPAPQDLVLQVGRLLGDGRVARGHPRFGHVATTDAVAGVAPEVSITIRYRARERRRADGSLQTLHEPVYDVRTPDGRALPDDLVLMPRATSQAQGAGLLDRVPEAAILANADGTGTDSRDAGVPRGRPAWIDTPDGPRLGRFGWQASEPDLASQIAGAFAREMGLTTRLLATHDCGLHDPACRGLRADAGPEVAPELFDALLRFQREEAVRRTPAAARVLDRPQQGARLFADTGCAACHRPSLPLEDGGRIAPYTDLLLHDLGRALDDRDARGRRVRSLWRTAPLWGLSTAFERSGEVRLLHDGRARGIDEAIGWHGGSAAAARERYDRLSPDERALLAEWVSSL